MRAARYAVPRSFPGGFDMPSVRSRHVAAVCESFERRTLLSTDGVGADGVLHTSVVRVTQVYVNGPALAGGSAAFRAAAGVDPAFGYAVPGGATQTTPASWVGGIDAVSVRFDTDVRNFLSRGMLEVRGSGGDLPVSGFAYDDAARTGTWTLETPVTADKLRLVSNGGGTWVGDNWLDGNWQNPSEAFPGVGGDTYPSGDGEAGGVFDFRINVLQGDVSGDGAVNATDPAEVKRRLTRRPGDGVFDPLRCYRAHCDVNADGVINATDLAQVKARLTSRINTRPTPESAAVPVPAPSPAPSEPAGVVGRVTEDVLAARAGIFA